jgi:hypothetical protein
LLAGVQFVKSIRYFLPIYPFWRFCSAPGSECLGLDLRLTQRNARHRQVARSGPNAGGVCAPAPAWTAFIQIYREPITRVRVALDVQTIEPARPFQRHFDDPLPLHDGQIAYGPGPIRVDLTLYDEDTAS